MGHKKLQAALEAQSRRVASLDAQLVELRDQARQLRQQHNAITLPVLNEFLATIGGSVTIDTKTLHDQYFTYGASSPVCIPTKPVTIITVEANGKTYKDGILTDVKFSRGRL